MAKQTDYDFFYGHQTATRILNSIRLQRGEAYSTDVAGLIKKEYRKENVRTALEDGILTGAINH